MLLEAPKKKNTRVRKAMAEAGIDQRKFSGILKISENELSIVLKRELAKAEQDELIRAIREWQKS